MPLPMVLRRFHAGLRACLRSPFVMVTSSGDVGVHIVRLFTTLFIYLF